MQEAVKRDCVWKVGSEQAWGFELGVSTASDGLGCSILEDCLFMIVMGPQEAQIDFS